MSCRHPGREHYCRQCAALTCEECRCDCYPAEDLADAFVKVYEISDALKCDCPTCSFIDRNARRN